MLKTGIIGLGDIAQKAYLPVLSKRHIDLHLCTRNKEKLSQIGEQYRIKNQHETLDSLIESGIKAAFVHTSTNSHYEVAEQLLLNGIHVFVDKPISYDYSSCEKLVSLAESRNLILMVGFNRRYATSYQKLKELQDPNMVILKKNRKYLPENVRTFVFDDFIHVVDTLRYMFPYSIADLIINGKKSGDQLYHVTIQFVAENGATAIGIMNRDSGTTEEILEVFSSQEKRVSRNVTDVVIFKDKNETRLALNDWESTLYRRGFDHMVDDFLQAVQENKSPKISKRDALLSHEICEKVVEKLNKL